MNLSANASFHSFDFYCQANIAGGGDRRLCASKKNSLDFFSYIGYNNEYM